MILDRLFRASLPSAPTISEPVMTLEAPQAGVNVDQWSGFQLSAVYACIRLLSDTLAQLPVSVIKIEKDTTEPAPDHPVNAVIARTPNPWMTSTSCRQVIQSHAVGWGNGYALIERNRIGGVNAVYPLLPDRTEPVIEEDRLLYRSTIGDREYEFKPEEILHIPALGFDGIKGVSPITAFRETLAVSIATQRFGARFFGSGSHLSGILKHPNRLKRKADNPNDQTPVDRLRQSFQKLYGGLDNSHRVAVLEEGMEFQQIGIPPEEAQFIETRKFQLAEIARIFNVPSHMINDLERATFNNISELSIGFMRYTMMPWIVKWEQELNRKFFSESERDVYRIKFNVNGLLRGTQKERGEFYSMAINGGWMSRNEVRKLEDLNPVDGLDNYLIPLNMGDGQDKPESPAGDENEPENDAGTERMINNYSPLVARFARQLSDADKKFISDAMNMIKRGTDKERSSLARWLNHDSREFIRRVLDPVLDSMARTGPLDSDTILNDMADWYRDTRQEQIDLSPPDAVMGLDEDAIRAKLETLIREASHGP